MMILSAFDQAVLGADMGKERQIAPLAMRREPMRRGMEPALCYPHKAAQMAAGQHAAILDTKLKLHDF
jgi:hypothetical protein